jgi:hypothetical protein
MNRGEYFLYLTDKVFERRRNHNLLLSYLFDTPFRWSYKIPTDANRARDGQLLRDRYANDTGDYILYEDKKEPCSVLEMLVALCMRVEEEITGEPGNEHPERWFWEIMKNLGLYSMTDGNFDEGRIITILDIWMKRKFRADGFGGAFPVKGCTKDQRLISIWDQMNLYLNEKLKGDFL